MGDLILDRGVYIRSMASRGSSGGLAATATQVADVLDAAGYDTIIYETVGVGQVELDIADAADSTMVLLVPEGGDIIQGMKAGLMEIGDIFVLNKSDRPGAERMQKDLEYVLHLKDAGAGWSPKVLPTVANRGGNIDTVWAEIGRHRQFLQQENLLEKRRRNRLRKQLKTLIRAEIEQRFWTEEREKILHDYLQQDQQDVSPYHLAARMVAELMAKS
jgi:LAO/AO transport system kinase